MNTAIRMMSCVALGCAFGLAAAQQSPPSAPPPSGVPAPEPPAAAAPKAVPAKATAQSEAGEPRANTSDSRAAAPEPKPRAAPRAATAGGQKPAGAIDRLDLGTATVTGDREQPKVMYIVPWKKPDIGDLAGKPMNSLVDEILAPVDRDVFKREVVYYQAVQADASQNGAPPKPSPQGEK